MNPADILKRHWGYAGFRPMQEEIINSVLGGHDTIGLLPTGGGKSVTFQVPAMMLPGITLVITPLISLMKDQVDNLAAVGIPATLFHSGLSRRERELAMTKCRLGKVKIVYLSPERLRNRLFLAELRSLDVSLLVVDEAHCISQWGYDFRPDYLRIASLRDTIGRDVAVLALTASATPDVVADIRDRLEMTDARLFARSFHRENLSYIVRHTDSKEQLLRRVLEASPGTAIVYVRSRRRTVELASMLSDAGFSAEAYHAGLDPDTKSERQDRWKSGQTRIIVATNAFGMGIDKPDVRIVIHADLPSSLEEYYQEAGRAGRDGLPSMAVALVNNHDKATLTRRLNEAFPPKDFIAEVYEKACVFLGIAVGDGYDKVFEFPFETFVARFGLPPVAADSALGILSRAGWLDYIADPASDSRVMFTISREEMYELTLDADTETVLESLMRLYTGLFAEFVNISEQRIGSHASLATQTVYEALLLLSRMHVIHYIPRSATPLMHIPTAREETRHIILPTEVYEDRRRLMAERIEAVRRFAFDSSECRVNTLLRYFGETPAEDCGQCDVCRSRRPRSSRAADPALDEAILSLLSQGPMSLSQLCSSIGGRTTARITEAVRLLIASEQLIIISAAPETIIGRAGM